MSMRTSYRTSRVMSHMSGNATNQELEAGNGFGSALLSLQEQSEQHCGTWLPDKGRKEPPIFAPECVWDNGNCPQNAAAEGPHRDHCERFPSDTPWAEKKNPGSKNNKRACAPPPEIDWHFNGVWGRRAKYKQQKEPDFIINFGLVGTALVMVLIGFFLRRLLMNATSPVRKTQYLMCSAFLVFSFFRDPFSVSLVKNFLEFSIVMPFVCAHISGWLCGAQVRTVK